MQEQYPRSPTIKPIYPPAAEIVPTVRKSPFGVPRASDALSSQMSIPNPCRDAHGSREKTDGDRRVTVAKLYRLPGSAGDCRSWLATRGHPFDMTCQATQP